MSPAGFALRVDDRGGLSVTWIEFFGLNRPNNVREGAKAYRASLTSRKLGAEGLFAIARGDKIIEKAADYRKAVRIVHAPVPGNDGHAEVRHFTDDDLELLDSLARDVFDEVIFVRELRLPKP